MSFPVVELILRCPGGIYQSIPTGHRKIHSATGKDKYKNMFTKTVYIVQWNIYPSSFSLSHAARTDFLTLLIHLNRPSLPAGLNSIMCLRSGVEGKFLLVDQLWDIHINGSIWEVTYKFMFAYPAVSRLFIFRK